MTTYRPSPRPPDRRNHSIGKSWRIGFVAVFFAGMVINASNAERPATYWISTAGDFYDPANWNLGAPGTSLDARIDNGGTALINSIAFQTIPYVYLGSAQTTSGTLEIISGGEASFTTMVVGALNATGTLRIVGSGKLTSFGGAIGSDYLGVGYVTVDGVGSLWKVTGSEMVVGGNGFGNVTLRNDGQLTIANGVGKLQLANHPVSEGNLFIGSGGLAGVLSASEIYNGEGKSTVYFNHSDPAYIFAPKFTGLKTVNGYLNIRHEGPGKTFLTATESNLAGKITVAAGTLMVTGSIKGSVKDVVIDDEIVPETTIGITEVLPNGTLGGTGFIEGDTTVRGVLSPGLSAGVLSFGGDLSLDSTGKVRIELGGRIRGTQFDGVDVEGALAYGGTLEIVFPGGFLPDDGDVFDLFDKFDSYSGTFGSISFGEEGFTGVFDPQTGRLTVIPEPGVAALLTLAAASLGLRRRSAASRAKVKESLI